MGSYTNADGSRVSFTDGETYRLVARLYAVVEEDHSTGSSNLENDQIRAMLTSLQQGKPLDDAQNGALQGLARKYQATLDTYQKSPDFKGQDFLTAAPAGQGRIIQECRLSPSGRLREYSDSEPRDGHGRWGSGGSNLQGHGGAATTPDAWPAVADVKTFQSNQSFDIHTGKWTVLDPQQGKYVPVDSLSPADKSRLSVREAASLSPSGQLRESTPSKSPKDTARSSAHLLDSTLHDLAHAKLHGDRLSDADVKKDPESQTFNVEHLMTHLVSALDHGSRLGKTLEKYKSDPATFAGERTALNGMRESAAPSPPNLRSASTTGESCGTCRMFDSGKCWGYGNVSVQAAQVCDEWAKDGKLKEDAGTPAREDSGRFYAGSKVHDPLLLGADPLHAAQVASTLIAKGRVRVGGQGPASQAAADDLAQRVGDSAQVTKLAIQGAPYIQLRALRPGDKAKSKE